MSNFYLFVEKLSKEIPLKIKYKDESWEMRLINLIVRWFNPRFMTDFTTVIGYTVYFSNRRFVENYPHRAMQILAHEAVHLLDIKRLTFPVFAFAYLFPQILVIFAFLFPLSPYFLIFLIFIAPFPAPFRAYFEARAYALDLILNRYYLENIVPYFMNWDYYQMYPYQKSVENMLRRWARNPDRYIRKVVEMYHKIV
ncbi:MAG: hypothetical protein MUE81_02395 [Thermoflexibacter sp.]|jgi:hypothetical protein|nr:hypothetical protein [Thermoflexibacter sp.]